MNVVVEAVAHHHHPECVQPSALDALCALAVAIAFSGGDDADGCARNLVPSAVVDATFLAGLESPLTWAQAQGRARDCLERIALESN